MSNIESLMINKLANTQQKLQVIKQSDKKDVIDFLDRSGGPESRSRKRSNSKFKRNNKLRNVHSIQAEAA